MRRPVMIGHAHHATVRRPRGARAFSAVAMLTLPLVAACAGGDGGATIAEASTTPVVRDTALLSAASLVIGAFDTAKVEKRGWRDGWTGPGRLTLDPSTTQLLGAIVDGRVSRVTVLPGDRVKRGQMLVSLDSHEMMDARARLADAEAGAARARNGLTLATAQAERAERLYAARALSFAELERARTIRSDAEATMLQAQAGLDYGRGLIHHLAGGDDVPAGASVHEVIVRAPFDGVVTSRTVQPGEVVLAGAPLVTVSRTADLVLLSQLPEQHAAEVEVGGDMSFTVASIPGRRFSARVTRISPVVDTLTRTVEVQAAVADAGPLRAEMFATVELLGLAGEPVLVVPAEAVQAMDGDTVVVRYTQRGDGAMVEAIPVKAGRRAAGIVEILRGVEEGERVVTTGASIAKTEILRRRGAAEAP